MEDRSGGNRATEKMTTSQSKKEKFRKNYEPSPEKKKEKEKMQK
jgi:hypothetical protein